jgi:hypothetical protein
MKTLLLLGAATLAAAAATMPAAGAPAAERMEPVRHFPNQKKTPGFYKGRTVRYLDFGPIRLAPGNRVAPIWAFTNGAPGQRNVIDVAPGDRGYTPLWRVTMVTWNDGATPRVLRSAAAVRRAASAGEVTLRRTATVVNCPVVGFGQRQTVGHFRGRLIAYLDLGPVKLRARNRVAPIWAFTNGAPDQHNVIDVVPGQAGYTPLWRVTMVTWSAGATARVLGSAAAIRSAAAGDVTLGRTATVVNCPVI